MSRFRRRLDSRLKKSCPRPRKSTFCGVILLTLGAILLWYFLYYRCPFGKSCGPGEKCLSFARWCDGVKDCSNGADESQCFRLQGIDFLLQGYSSDDNAWLPVCAENWNDNYGSTVCVQMGYDSKFYESSSQVSFKASAPVGFLKLKSGSSFESPIQTQLMHSPECSVRAVKLHCIECGKSFAAPSGRVVGGSEAVKGAWPWQVSLQVYHQHVCGGTILSSYWILTAAHCFQTLSDAQLWTVTYGDVQLSKMPTRMPTERIVSHEKFNPKTNDFDIALLRLSKPITFKQRTVRPLCLPNVELHVNNSKDAWVTGWGQLYASGPSPDKLHQAQVTIYVRELCNHRYVLNGRVTDTMFCAGKMRGGVDTCQGDSGGPLVFNSGDVWWLIGITSWGFGCGLKTKPGMYSNVSYFREWIQKQMQDEWQTEL